MSRAGDGLLSIGLLVWVSVAVGPWWLGLALYLAAWIVNILEDALRK